MRRSYFRMAAAKKLWNRKRKITAASAVVAFCMTIVVLMLPAIALSNKEVVMDCPLSVHKHSASCYQIDENGNKILTCGQADYVVHTHDEACYDSEGNLICTLPEIQEHIHDESCYEEQQVLVCDLEENENHTHTDECYKTEKKLICGKDELHTHNESCFDADGNMICDKIVLMSHQHDDECLKEVKKSGEEKERDRESEPAAQDQTSEGKNAPIIWEESTDKVTVHVEAEPGAFPEGTTMQVTDVDDDGTIRSVKEAVDGKVRSVKAVDISFIDPKGREIEPAKPIRVSMTSRHKDSRKKEDLTIIHVDDEGKVSEVGDVDVDQKKKEATATFTAEEFSVYAVVYTVDFLTADGERFNITIEYDDEAEIPKNAELKVREIPENSDEYSDYLTRSVEKLGAEDTEVRFARFFDIEITSDGQKIEPKAPVQVTIQQADALPVYADDKLDIVHFADTGNEVISDIALSDDHTAIQYEQSSFSVTGAIITSPTAGSGSNPSQYALIVKYDESFYSVNSDGSLSPVTVNDPGNPTSVVIGSPMLWTYASNGNIYHHTDAVDTGFGEVAADFYYKYIDVNSEDGVYAEEQITNFTKGQDAVRHGEGYTEPSKENDDVKLVVRNTVHPTGFGQLAWTVQTHKQADRCRTNYDNSTHLLTNSDHSRVLDVEEENGVLHLVSKPAGSGNGAEVYFTDVHASVPVVSPYNHTVNHIDISIDSTANVEVPLAYGTYYDAGGNEVLRIDRQGNYYEKSGGSWVIARDDKGNSINHGNELKVPHPIVVTGEDIKAGTITATDEAGNPVENAFYVSGYSANAPSGDNNWQVRIEGSFKVATSNPVNPNAGTPNSWDVMQDRLNKKVYYTVSTVKHGEVVEVSYKGTPLYDNHRNLLKFNVDISIESDKFNYWDSRNDCPALTLSNYQWWDQNGLKRWADGGIYTGPDPKDSDWYMSGIDTDIAGDKVTSKADVLAMEITKYIVDEEGNTIALQAGQNLENTFEVYEKTPDYEPDDVKGLNPGDAIRGTHTLPQSSYEAPEDGLYQGYDNRTELTINVDSSGKGEVHNYDVGNGLYYIKEKPDSISETVKGADGKIYQYVSTIMESEYAWRNDNYQKPNYQEAVHVSPVYSDRSSDAYRSIPEVIGEYKDKDGSWTQEDGTLLRNTFLPFYVYNVYKPVVEEVSATKQWQGTDGEEASWPADVTFKILKKTVTQTEDGEEVTYSELAKPVAYEKNEPWSATIRTTSGNRVAKWKNLNALNDNETYVIIEYEVEGATDVVRDPKSGAILHFKLDGKMYDAFNSELPYDAEDTKVINKESLRITLKKVEKDDLNKDNPDLLKGASFTLSKYTGDDFRVKDADWGNEGSMTASDEKKPDGTYTLNGEFTFEGLVPGYYQLEENVCPDGHVKLTDNPTFKIERNGSGKTILTLINNPDNLLVLDDDNLTIFVGNEPGAALPNTGGPGTDGFVLLGIMLTGLAGTGLLMRKRRRTA